MLRHFVHGFATLSALCLCLAACRQTPKPDFGPLYDRAASYHGIERNPIVVIPGILGSRLEAPDGEVVWGAFSGRFANPESARGAELVALPMRRGAGLAELRDEVRPAGVLEDLEVSLLGLPVRLDAYRHVLRTLGVGGYRDESLGLSGAVDYGDDHFTCFQFAYDWRRDLVENARALGAFLTAKRDYVKREWEKRYGPRTEPIRFDIVAHSMGGLLARYYLRYGGEEPPKADPKPTWAGAKDVDRAVLVGTPNMGSLLSLAQMIEGVDYSILTPRYSPAILGSMPAVYQLLPRRRHGALRVRGSDARKEAAKRVDATAASASSSNGVSRDYVDPLDPDEWIRREWGLADPREDAVLRWLLPRAQTREERRAIALDHLRKCLARARVIHRALDVEAKPPRGLELYIFSGDALATAASAVCDAQGRAFEIKTSAPGDGTVLRTSALGDERVGQAWAPSIKTPITWNGVHFVFSDHLEMTKDPSFVDNVLFRLLEAPRSQR